MKFEEIAKLVDPKDEVFFYDPEEGIAAILDIDSHIKHLYKTENASDFTEITPDINGMAKKLKEGMDTEAFLVEVLKTTAPAQLIEIIERLEHPKAKVTSKPRCFSLMIGGKQGAPLELTLRR